MSNQEFQRGAAPIRPIPGREVPRKRLYTVSDAMQLLSLGRTAIYEQMRAGRLRKVKQGRTTLIPATAIEDYVALLEREAQEDTHNDQAA